MCYDFITEVATVVHKNNISDIVSIGMLLKNINSSIIWRLDEYYPIGLKADKRKYFELKKGQFEECIGWCNLSSIIHSEKFDFFPVARRKLSNEFMITQSGKLINTSQFNERNSSYDILKGKLPKKFDTLRSWEEHKEICRVFK